MFDSEAALMGSGRYDLILALIKARDGFSDSNSGLPFERSLKKAEISIAQSALSDPSNANLKRLGLVEVKGDGIDSAESVIAYQLDRLLGFYLTPFHVLIPRLDGRSIKLQAYRLDISDLSQIQSLADYEDPSGQQIADQAARKLFDHLFRVTS